jgi:anaerobic ribonucleoside-triphosphate reductase activating protein
MADALSSESFLRVARVTHGTTAEGPNLRTALWVQGCSIRCKGCINPHLFSARGGTLVAPQMIIDEAIAAGDEGLTLLGASRSIKPRRSQDSRDLLKRLDLGVICFTGYTVETVRDMPHGKDLLRHVDLLIDGSYVADTPDVDRALVGSTNQRFIHFSDRYADYDPARIPDRVDLRILPNGEVSIAGFLTAERVVELANALGARRSMRA